MKQKISKLISMFFVLFMTVFAWGCGDITTGNEELDQAIVDMVVDGVNSYLEDATDGEDETGDIVNSEEVPVSTNTPTPIPTKEPDPTATPTLEPAIDEDGWYYSKDEVALYIYTYGKLPENFITKSEAQDLGWTGGTVENYKEGAAIGGDKFGNREGLLPKKSGRQYYECDIDTKGKGSRGAKRIVFSNDGLIYYTGNHYESFELLYGEE